MTTDDRILHIPEEPKAPAAPMWQAVPPPAIRLQGVDGRYREKLNGSYALTPHNGPKPALTYVNPHNNSCIVYGEHQAEGKAQVDFTGWVAGWTRDNRPDDFFICAKGEVCKPNDKHSEGELNWKMRDNDGHFEENKRIQIIPLKNELNIPIDLGATPANLGARTPLGHGGAPTGSQTTPNQPRGPREIPGVPPIVPYTSPHALTDGQTPHFGGPVRHRANEAKQMMSADLLAAAGASGAWTTPWSATQAAVGFHFTEEDQPKLDRKTNKRPSLVEHTDGALRADAPSYIPTGQAFVYGHNAAEEANRGIEQELIEEAGSHAAGGLFVTAKNAAWTIQENTTEGNPIDSPVFRLKSAAGRTGPPMQMRFCPQSQEGRAGHVSLQLICQQGTRMKFKLYCDAQNSGNKVLMVKLYTMDFPDPKLNSITSPRSSNAKKPDSNPNHRLMTVGLELVYWM